MFKVLTKNEVDTMRPDLVRSFHKNNPVLVELRRINKMEAVKVNKNVWESQYKSPPAYGNLKPKKFERYTTQDGIYWVIVRVA